MILPIAASVAILLIHLAKPGIGATWLVAVLASFINWGVLIFYRFAPPPPLIISQWLPMGGVSGSFIYQLDNVAWVYTFCLASLLVAVLLTASARLQFRSNPGSWAACLAIIGVGSLATLSATPLAFVFAWMVVDLFELAAILVGVPDAKIKIQAVIGFSVRSLGSLLVILAMYLSASANSALVIIAPPQEVGVILLIAVGLRLGVLPLHLPYTQELPMRRGLGTILRMTAPIGSLVLLARLPAAIIPVEFSATLLALTGLATVYGAGMWAFSSHEIKGRPYWLISLAGMAVASVIRGYPAASIAWGMAVVISGGIIFLYSLRSKGLFVFPILGLIFLSGLPFTPAASGWVGLVTLPINLPDLLFFLAHGLLLFGYIKNSLRPEEPTIAADRWVHITYRMGFVVLAICGLFIMVIGGVDTFTPGIWWASTLSALISVGSFFLVQRIIKSSPSLTEERWFIAVGKRVGDILSAVFSLSWFYRGMSWFFLRLGKLIHLFSNLLEGDGGVLWVIVMLAMLLSVSLKWGIP